VYGAVPPVAVTLALATRLFAQLPSTLVQVAVIEQHVRKLPVTSPSTKFSLIDATTSVIAERL
jgi:hypothetical protein